VSGIALLVAHLIAIVIGPFALAYLRRPLLGLALPAGYLLLWVLSYDEPPEYDMRGIGTYMLILGALIAAIAWAGGFIGAQVHARRRRTK
jgi:hypothetical protein